jgi:hypothetical protein
LGLSPFTRIIPTLRRKATAQGPGGGAIDNQFGGRDFSVSSHGNLNVAVTRKMEEAELPWGSAFVWNNHPHRKGQANHKKGIPGQIHAGRGRKEATADSEP